MLKEEGKGEGRGRRKEKITVKRWRSGTEKKEEEERL
jgi:hypothetical protein